MKPTYLVQGAETLAKFEHMSIDDLVNVFQVEHVVNNGDHYILRTPVKSK